MVGDGELRDQVEEMIHKFDLGSSFLITGWVDNPTAYMKIMDVGMLLSRWEGFGLVLPEYMACGVPIIATNVDAIPNIVKDGVNGMLINKDSFVGAQKVCTRLNSDTELKDRIIASAKSMVKNKFVAKRVAKESIGLYKDLEKQN